MLFIKRLAPRLYKHGLGGKRSGTVQWMDGCMDACMDTRLGGKLNYLVREGSRSENAAAAAVAAVAIAGAGAVVAVVLRQRQWPESGERRQWTRVIRHVQASVVPSSCATAADVCPPASLHEPPLCCLACITVGLPHSVADPPGVRRPTGTVSLFMEIN